VKSAPPKPAATPIAVVPPADPPPAPTKPDNAPLPRWSQLRVGTLPDGLTYYILPNAKPARRARIWLAVKAGSVQEDDDQLGVAHLVEHMAFDGTKRFPKKDIVNYFERIGMRFGADLNAVTSYDHTIYKLEIPLDDPGYLMTAFDMLHDWASDVTFDPAELGAAGTAAKERGVVVEEWRSRRGARMRLFDKQASVVFDGSRYAARSPIGTVDAIEHASRDAIIRFYKDWYRPDLMAVIIVGDFKDPDAIEKQIRDHFADLPAASSPRKRTSGGMPSGKGTRISVESDPEAAGTSVEIASFSPYAPQNTKLDYRRELAQSLYMQILRERLAAIARRSSSPFVSTTTAVVHVLEGANVFTRDAHARPGHAEDALRALLTEVARIERFGVTPGELARAKTVLLRDFDIRAERVSESKSLCEEITRLFFDHEQMSGPKVEVALVHEIVPTITANELDGAINIFAGDDNRVVSITGSDAKTLPARDRVLAVIDEVGKAELTPWQDTPPPETLMTALPAPGSITAQKLLAGISAVEWTLSNGVRVVVKPTKFEQDAVLLEGAAAGGDAMADDKDFANARLANSLASSLGLGELDVGALRDVLHDKHLSLSTSIGESRETISATGTERDLETMLQLVYLRMTSPREDADEIAAWQQSTADKIADGWNVPEIAFSRDVVEALYGHTPRRLPPDAAAVTAADPAKALAFYKARFGDASGFTFVIVGSVKLDVVRPLVEKYLAALPAVGPPAKERDLGIRKARGVVVKRWKHGSEPKAFVEIEFHGDQPWSLESQDDMFVLGEILRMQLRDVLREDLGGIYSVSVNASIGRAPHASRTLLISFGCDPARVNELVKATLGVAADIVAKGPSADYLDRVRKQYLRTYEKNITLNSAWLSWLAAAYRYGDDPDLFLDNAHALARMTQEKVQAAARQLLDPTQYFEGVLEPVDATK
jgi:zinc protease